MAICNNQRKTEQPSTLWISLLIWNFNQLRGKMDYIVVKKINAHICMKICTSAKIFTSSWTFVHTQFQLRLLDIFMIHLKGNSHLFSTQYYIKMSLCLSQTFVEFLASPSLCFFSSVQCALCTGYSVCAMHIKLLRTASNVLLPCSTQVIVTSPDDFVCFFTWKWD